MPLKFLFSLNLFTLVLQFLDERSSPGISLKSSLKSWAGMISKSIKIQKTLLFGYFNCQLYKRYPREFLFLKFPSVSQLSTRTEFGSNLTSKVDRYSCNLGGGAAYWILVAESSRSDVIRSKENLEQFWGKSVLEVFRPSPKIIGITLH